MEQDNIFVFFLCKWELEKKEFVLLFCVSAIWTNTFCNLDKYILQFNQIGTI